jgi:hypothetical protein
MMNLKVESLSLIIIAALGAALLGIVSSRTHVPIFTYFPELVFFTTCESGLEFSYEARY